MAIAIRHAPIIASGRAVTSTRSTRKIGLFGAHMPSLTDAPWTDPSWELWGHASARSFYSRPMDLYFDLHPRACWTRGGKKGGSYPQWLAHQTTPIYMQHRFEEVPASMEYPRRRVLQEFSYAHRRQYFANHVAWMIALAILEGATVVGLWGINYAIEGEYLRQRGSAEYWLGQLDGRGIGVVLPEQCTLLADPARLYGYDSHDAETGLLVPEYGKKVWPKTQDLKPGVPGAPRAVPTPEIAKEIEEEERDFPRPAWALGALPKQNGSHAEA
jgi:hypothetical protein